MGSVAFPPARAPRFPAAVLLGSLLLAGCATLLAVPEQQEKLLGSVVVGGEVHTEGGPARGPLVVGLLARRDSGEFDLVDHFVAEREGRWAMAAEPGDYLIAAFEDVDANGHYNDEPATVWRQGEVLTLKPGERRRDVDLSIPRAGRFSRRAFSIEELQARGRNEQQIVSLFALSAVGQQVSLDAPRFAREIARSGLWKPYDFVVAGYPGIYFLEPWDGRRIPVLFVHGIGGTPIEFRDMIAALDRSRFQAWVAYYPSGMALDTLGHWMSQLFSRLHVRYQFKRAAVVAHSMGGLIARDFILKYESSGETGVIRTYVTISSPFGGMESAGKGVEKSPIVVLSWRGLAPGSEFLDGLFYSDFPARRVRRRLPESVAYHMLFGFRGGGLSGSSDGVVAMSSQLRPEAQEEARSLRGYDATHTGILSDPAAVARVTEILGSMR